MEWQVPRPREKPALRVVRCREAEPIPQSEVYRSTWSYREGVGGERSGGALGKFTIVGRVVDVDGNAVVDAEVIEGKTEGWKIVSGAEIDPGESVAIVVDYGRCVASVVLNLTSSSFSGN